MTGGHWNPGRSSTKLRVCRLFLSNRFLLLPRKLTYFAEKMLVGRAFSGDIRSFSGDLGLGNFLRFAGGYNWVTLGGYSK